MYEDLDESMRIYANSIVNDSYLRGAMSFGAKPTISITKDSSLNVGYRVRLEIKLRHNIEDVLKVIQRKLLQLEIESTVKERESSHRPRPILIIRGIDNLDKTITFLDATWIHQFSYCLEVVKSGEHLTQSGLDEILREKEML